MTGTRIGLRRWHFVALLGVLMLVAAACGGDSADETTTTTTEAAETTTTTAAPDTTTTTEAATTTTEAPEPTDVSIRLDFFTFNGYHSPFHVAAELGYYAEENLNVTIGEGQGSNGTATAVGAGEDTFGFVTGDTIVRFRQEGLAIRSVANHFRNTGFCLISPVEAGIDTPEELAGTQVASPPFGSSGNLLVGYLENFGLTDSVEIISVESTAVAGLLLSGELDAWTSTAFGFPVQFKEEFGEDTNCLLFKDAGVDPVGWNIIATDEFIDANPEVVEGFVRATLRGWEYTLENHIEAGEITQARVPTTTGPETAAASIQVILDTGLATQETDTLRFGENDPEAWQNTIDLMVEYLGLENPPPTEDLYTNDFIPDSLP